MAAAETTPVPAAGSVATAPSRRRASTARPPSATASASTATTEPAVPVVSVSSSSVIPSTTDTIGSNAMLVATAGASTPVLSAIWLSVIEA